MKFASRAYFALAIALITAPALFSQEYMRIPESAQPSGTLSIHQLPRLAWYNKAGELDMRTQTPSSKTSGLQKSTEAATQIAVMWNTYSTMNSTTAQISQDPTNNTVGLIFRGNRNLATSDGSLYYCFTTNNGQQWSSERGVVNQGLFNDRNELRARHPSMFAFNNAGQTEFAGLWGEFKFTAINPEGYLGQIFSRNSNPAGPFQGGSKLIDNTLGFTTPQRIVRDGNGKLYSMTETVNDQDLLTNQKFVITSTDNGDTWQIDLSNPALVEPLPDNYSAYSPKLDVSPDGQTLYIGFVALLFESGSAQLVNDRIGYVRSTDGGTTWSQPVLNSYDEVDVKLIGVDQLEGWVNPDCDMAVDANGNAHLLVTVYSSELYLPIDSTAVGEITWESGGPVFWPLAYVQLPRYEKFLNPINATDPEQPKYIMWNEQGWAKSLDGTSLVAKWIDAPRYWIIDPIDSVIVGRDSLHDIYMSTRVNVNDMNDSTRGWTYPPRNISSTENIDEKMSKITRDFVQGGSVSHQYTIMAEGEFLPGVICQDCNDQDEATLFAITSIVLGIEQTDSRVPAGFTLSQNYPNPFNPSTTIEFSVPTAKKVTLRVFNMLGREVATVVDEIVKPGSYKISFDASNLPSGNYVYRLESGASAVSKVMTLMK